MQVVVHTALVLRIGAVSACRVLQVVRMDDENVVVELERMGWRVALVCVHGHEPLVMLVQVESSDDCFGRTSKRAARKSLSLKKN